LNPEREAKMLEVATSIEQAAITKKSFVTAEAIKEFNFRDAAAHIRAENTLNQQEVDQGMNMSVNPISIHSISDFFKQIPTKVQVYLKRPS
jgi:hypothetical protein